MSGVLILFLKQDLYEIGSHPAERVFNSTGIMI